MREGRLIEGRKENGRLLLSAALASAPAEFVGFLLPLWAAARLGASPFEVGVVLATVAAASLIVRPIAGTMADRRSRTRLISAGALAYALALLGFAAAGSVAFAIGVAVVFGAGGAIFWVAVRARLGEGTDDPSAHYGRLLAYESRGAFVGFATGFFVLGSLGYDGIFLLGALACVAAAALVGSIPETVHRTTRNQRSTRADYGEGFDPS